MNPSNESVLQLLPEQRLEMYPCAIFLDKFTKAELEQAVKEYVKIHNFQWSDYRYPQPKGLAQDLEFMKQDFPEDMADAMSLEALSNWLEAKPLSEAAVREFCQTVCSVAQGMYYLYRYSKQPFSQIEDTFASAIALQYALYPQSAKLKQ